ncbi:glycosyltransferase family 4 protein [Novipirellula galeiformis]|nr:glycosyltransferase family 4 protein [Novipirellula galeiformis]
MMRTSKLASTGNTDKTPKHLSLVLSEVFPPQNGGSGKWLWEIYRRQTPHSYIMAVGDSHGCDTRDKEYPQVIERLDLSMPFRGIAAWSSVRKYTQQIRKVAKLARHHRVSSLHAARPLSEGLVCRAVKAMTGIPYLCYVHGEDVNIAMTSRELQMLTRSVLHHCQRVIANSTFTRDLLLNEWKLDPNSVVLMNPGVDTSYFTPRPADQPNWRAHWEGKFVMLTVGRLQERKGHDMVIRAIPKIRERIPEIHYAIVGGGQDRARLERLCRELNVTDHVEFVGEVDDKSLLRCYQDCDLFVLANRDVGRDVEGFGIVLLEAQACGKPVLAGDSGGTRDTLRPNESGFLVDCVAPEPLANVICERFSSPSERAAFGLAGRAFVSKTFDWSILGTQAQKLFNELNGR